MLVFNALEDRAPGFILAFAGACLASSLYGFAQGAWPFGVVELVWAGVAVRRWRHPSMTVTVDQVVANDQVDRFDHSDRAGQRQRAACSRRPEGAFAASAGVLVRACSCRGRQHGRRPAYRFVRLT